jgi:branched-subunit amino acid transport protein
MTQPGFDSTSAWTIIPVVGIGTYGLRLSFLVIFGWLDDLPTIVERILQLVPPAVFAALVIPALTHVDGQLALGQHNPKLIAGLFAGLVAWKTENMLLTIVVGMGTLWLVSATLT